MKCYNNKKPEEDLIMNMKKMISVLVALSLMLTMTSVFCGVSFPAKATAVLAYGEVGAQGNNVTWTLTDDNVLTLSGEGATADYSTSPGWDDPGRHGPWWYSEYANRVTTVVVEEGITHLGKCLFEGDTSLTSAELPDSLETLGDRVFCSCNLTELPNLGKVTEIPSHAFVDNPLSETLTIPDGIETIGDNAFKSCDNVKNVILPKTVTYVAHHAFCECPVKTLVQPAALHLGYSFNYNDLDTLTLIGPPVTFSHGFLLYLASHVEVLIPSGCSYAGLSGNYPQILYTSMHWYDFGEDFRFFIDDVRNGYSAESAFDYNLSYWANRGYIALMNQSFPAESPLVIGEDGTYPNVFGEAKVSIDPNSDTYTFVPEQAATCEEDGHSAYYECSNGKYYTFENGVYTEIGLDDTVIPGGHVYGEEDWTPATAADCGNDGVLPHFTCRRCGKPIDEEGNVMETAVDSATGAHDWSVEWAWTENYTASATFTCPVCEQEKTLPAEVTYAAGIYTAIVELDGTPYTDEKAKTVTLTFDMGGKCDNYVVEAEAGADMVNHYMAAMNSAQAEGFVMTGFAPLPPENYETINAFNAASSALFTSKVPETDAVYYGFWKTLITPEIAVGELRCGASLPDTLPQITPSEPDKVAVYEQHWYDAEGTAVGGQAYAMYVSLEADYSWAFTADAPVVSGADTVDFRALRVLDTLELNVTAQHYTDGTSRRTETVITPATATTAGEKQICIYCAGGCGEIVDTYTEPIPATGAPDEPDEPADTDNVCPWCGEIHDKSTFVGFWTEFIHDLLYILRQLFSWWF